jgi:hypothetical protein
LSSCSCLFLCFLKLRSVIHLFSIISLPRSFSLISSGPAFSTRFSP